jgi:hypothetical protein
VIRGWITIDTEAFDVGSTITLKANTDPELDGTAAWQTKVQNEKGEEAWEICGYGETLTIKLTKDNINSTYRFKMEGENYSEEYTLGSISEEDEENEKVIEHTEDEDDLPDDQLMLEMGYYKVQVANRNGANVYESMDNETEAIDHLDTLEECWLKRTENSDWAEMYAVSEEEKTLYVLWEDVVILVKPEGDESESEELPARNIIIHSTQEEMTDIAIGTPITLTAELINFREDDVCDFQWQYLDEATGTYIDIEGANDQTYTYNVSMENFFNTWMLVVTFSSAEL